MGGRRDALASNPQTAARIRAYLELAGHGDDRQEPLFLPLSGNAKAHDPAGRIDLSAVDRVLRKYAAGIGLAQGYSAHSMRATFITTALEIGAQLRTCRRQRDIVTRQQLKLMIVGATITRRQLVFSRHNKYVCTGI